MKTLFADLKLVASLFFISLLIFAADRFGVLNFPKSLIQTITIPVQFGIYQSGISWEKQFKFIVSARTAAQENKALQLQLAELVSDKANLQKQLAESQALIQQDKTLALKTFNMNPARPIGLGRYLLIDKGSQDGVGVGDIVVFKDNYIGQIKQLSSKTAEIMLSSDPDSKIAVFSQGISGKARGILQGQFSSEMTMDKILHQESISVGDLVYSEGTENKVPRGLIIGKVVSVNDKQNEVFKQANVKPIFNTDDLDLVFIIKDS